jgi:hypothetical protein
MTSHLLAINLRDSFFSSHPDAQPVFTSPGSLLSILLPNVIVLGGVMFFLYIVWGGWDMITGAGKSGNPSEMQKAWNKITYGLVGFLIVVGSFFILQIIETLTGVDLITIPTL